MEEPHAELPVAHHHQPHPSFSALPLPVPVATGVPRGDPQDPRWHGAAPAHGHHGDINTNNTVQGSVRKGISLIPKFIMSFNLGPSPPRPPEKRGVTSSGGRTTRPGRKPKVVPFDSVAARFNMPIEDASRDIGVCVTVIKKACRHHGLSRWPYRKIQSFLRPIYDYHGRQSSGFATECDLHALHSKVCERERGATARAGAFSRTRPAHPLPSPASCCAQMEAHNGVVTLDLCDMEPDDAETGVDTMEVEGSSSEQRSPSTPSQRVVLEIALPSQLNAGRAVVSVALYGGAHSVRVPLQTRPLEMSANVQGHAEAVGVPVAYAPQQVVYSAYHPSEVHMQGNVGYYQAPVYTVSGATAPMQPHGTAHAPQVAHPAHGQPVAQPYDQTVYDQLAQHQGWAPRGA